MTDVGSCSVTRPGTEYVPDGGAGGITASTDTKLRYRLESSKRLCYMITTLKWNKPLIPTKTCDMIPSLKYKYYL